jgi:hypothetical protein
MEEALLAERPPALEIGVSPAAPMEAPPPQETQSPAYWPASPMPPRPLTPPPGFLCATLEDRRAPVVGVSVLGLAGAELEARVRQISLQQRTDMNFIPVFLTDSPSSEVFVRYGYAFEYLPAWRYANAMDDATAARLRFLARKWNFRSVSYLDAGVQSGPPSDGDARSPPAEDDATISSMRATGGVAIALAPTPAEAADQAAISEDARMIRESGLFDEEWYLANNRDVAASGEDPVAHYLRTGAKERRDPSPLFDTAYYAQQMDRHGRRDGG